MQPDEVRNAANVSEREAELLLTLEDIVRAARFPDDRRLRSIHAVLAALTQERKR